MTIYLFRKTIILYFATFKRIWYFILRYAGFVKHIIKYRPSNRKNNNSTFVDKSFFY